MTRVAIGVAGVLGILLAVQTWRLGLCQEKADRLETCLEVDEIEQEIQDATDADLVDALSDSRLQ